MNCCKECKYFILDNKTCNNKLSPNYNIVMENLDNCKNYNNLNVDKYKAQNKYHEKIGYISKSYKVNKDIANYFRLACLNNNVSQSSVLKELMIDYITKSLE